MACRARRLCSVVVKVAGDCDCLRGFQCATAMVAAQVSWVTAPRGVSSSTVSWMWCCVGWTSRRCSQSMWRWSADGGGLPLWTYTMCHVECRKDSYNNHIDSNHNQEIACGSLWSSDPPRPEECSSQGSLVKPKANNGPLLQRLPFAVDSDFVVAWHGAGPSSNRRWPDAGCFSACRGWIAPGTGG